MLAKPALDANDLPADPVLERKYDGFRALGAVACGEAALQSRSGVDLGDRFPSVVRDLAALTGEAVLDGEIIGEATTGSSFGAVAAGEPVRFVAFDLLRSGSDDLRLVPLRERRRRLEELLGGQPRILVAERVQGPLEEALATARRMGWEGLVAKASEAPYRGGRDGSWRKVRLVAAQDVVVIGWRPLEGARREMGALLVAVAAPEGLRYAGRVGTGFSEADRRVFRETLEQLAVKVPAARDAPRTNGNLWVEPVVVAEVHLREWTRNGLLRQPSFVRVRLDKHPAECVVEAAPFRFARC